MHAHLVAASCLAVRLGVMPAKTSKQFKALLSQRAQTHRYEKIHQAIIYDTIRVVHMRCIVQLIIIKVSYWCIRLVQCLNNGLGKEYTAKYRDKNEILFAAFFVVVADVRPFFFSLFARDTKLESKYRPTFSINIWLVFYMCVCVQMTSETRKLR